MKRSSAKQKGKDFEKYTGEVLGNWWHGDPFPRSHGSGSATSLVNVLNLRQAGDLYVPLEFPWSVECKNNNMDWSFDRLAKGSCKEFGAWWRQTCKDAKKVDRWPLLVITKNHMPAYACMSLLAFVDLLGLTFIREFSTAVIIEYNGKRMILIPLEAFVQAVSVETVKEAFNAGSRVH